MYPLDTYKSAVHERYILSELNCVQEASKETAAAAAGTKSPWTIRSVSYTESLREQGRGQSLYWELEAKGHIQPSTVGVVVQQEIYYTHWSSHLSEKQHNMLTYIHCFICNFCNLMWAHKAL